MDIRCKSLVDVIEKHIPAIPHDDGLVRLTMFSHDSPGLKQLRRQIAEGLAAVIEREHTVSKKRAKRV